MSGGELLAVVCTLLCFTCCYLKSDLAQNVAVHVIGNEKVAEKVARHHGCKISLKVFNDEDIYLMAPSSFPSNCSDTYMRKDSRVLWSENQNGRILSIKKWDTDSESEADSSDATTTKKPGFQARWNFNDPFFSDQWYLRNEGQTGGKVGNDLHIIPVWKAGFTGRGITLTVIDDGIQYTHPDISTNYEPDVSTDLVDMDDDPFPEPVTKGNSHGTYCAAIMAAVANNSICGVGIAYEAKVGGTRLVSGPVTDYQEAMALLYGIEKLDIVSASWGPADDGRGVSGPGKLAARAFQRGVQKGRDGKGIIYVWAVGNGGRQMDNCNMDGYTCSIYTLSIGALNDDGLSAFYSEPCACVMASAYVGGVHSEDMPQSEIVSEESKGQVVVPELNGGCVNNFQGTSAAAPMAAAILALALQANGQLTWRDVQYLVVKSARIANPSESDWQMNAAGYHFHLRYGFGVLDAASLVAMATNWTLVGPQLNVTVVAAGRNRRKEINVEIADTEVGVVEHVVATVDLTSPRRGNAELFLESPMGTVSQLLTKRPRDYTSKKLKKWPFTSVHFWGEDPRGTWKLRVVDDSGRSALTGCSLTVYGVERSTGKRKRSKGNNNFPNYLNETDLSVIMDKERKVSAKRLRQLQAVTRNDF